MSYEYSDYDPATVYRAITATSSICIFGALVVLGLSVFARPAHPATRGTRIASALTAFAAVVLIASHIPPLVRAIQYLRNPYSEGKKDLGHVTLALQGLALIFEIAACRSVFYLTLPLGLTRKKRWTFILLDLLSFGALVGTFIGALIGRGLCWGACVGAREVATVFWDNTNTSGGMHGTSLFSLIVVLAGAICASKWSPQSPLARSLRISLPVLATLQFALTLTCIMVAVIIAGRESWNQEVWDPIYYASIPFWLLQPVVLCFIQISLQRNPKGVLGVDGIERGIVLNEQSTEARKADPAIPA